MKAQRLLPLCSALFLGLAAAPAFAGSSSVSNSWNIRDIKDGYSKTTVDIKENYWGTRDAYSSATKNEWGYNVVTDNLTPNTSGYRKGHKPQANGPTLFEFDAYDITATSHASEWGAFDKTTKIDVHEDYYFDGLDKTHTVTSSFSF